MSTRLAKQKMSPLPIVQNVFSEKCILIIEYVQIIAVIINSTYTWPTYFKYQLSPYIQFVNLDIYPYMLSSPSTMSLLPIYWYWIYASLVTIVSYVVILMSDTIRKFEYCLADKTYIEKIEEISSKYEKYTYKFCRLFIIPSLQLTLRLFQCTSVSVQSNDNSNDNNNNNETYVNQHVVYVDNTVQCYSYHHFIRAFLILGPLFLAFLVYLLSYHERINQSLINYYDENIHLKYVRSRKLESILELTQTFYTSGTYLTEHLHFYHLNLITIWNLVKLSIVSLYILFESYNVNEYNKARTYGITISAFFVLLLHVIWSIHKGGYLPYRVPTINLLWFVLNLTLLLVFGVTILKHDINIANEEGQRRSVFTIDVSNDNAASRVY